MDSGLKIHEYYVNESLRPFHDKMVMMFSAMKTSIETGQPMEVSRRVSIILGHNHRSIPAGT